MHYVTYLTNCLLNNGWVPIIGIMLSTFVLLWVLCRSSTGKPGLPVLILIALVPLLPGLVTGIYGLVELHLSIKEFLAGYPPGTDPAVMEEAVAGGRQAGTNVAVAHIIGGVLVAFPPLLAAAFRTFLWCREKDGGETLDPDKPVPLVTQLWRGDIPLWKTFWIYCVAVLVAGNVSYSLLIPFLLQKAVALEKLAIPVIILSLLISLFLLFYWLIFICPAIWRSSGKYEGPVVFKVFARMFVVGSAVLFCSGLVYYFLMAKRYSGATFSG